MNQAHSELQAQICDAIAADWEEDAIGKKERGDIEGAVRARYVAQGARECANAIRSEVITSARIAAIMDSVVKGK